jgi:hypothetical protein
VVEAEMEHSLGHQAGPLALLVCERTVQRRMDALVGKLSVPAKLPSRDPTPRASAIGTRLGPVLARETRLAATLWVG